MNNLFDNMDLFKDFTFVFLVVLLFNKIISVSLATFALYLKNLILASFF